MKKRTRVTHPPDVAVPPDNRPLVAPIYQSVKFTFDDVEQTRAAMGGASATASTTRVSPIRHCSNSSIARRTAGA